MTGYQCNKEYTGRRIKTNSIRKVYRAGTAQINACGNSRLRGLRSRKPIGFRQWVVHMKAMAQSLNFGKPVSDNSGGMFVTFL